MQEVFIIDKEIFNKNQKYYEDLIINFYKDNGQNYTKKSLNIKRQINIGGVFYSCYLKNNKILCLARLAKLYINYKQLKTFYILRQIDTLVDFRKQGLAEKVLKSAFDYLRTKKAKKVVSMVDESNFASIKLHKKFGFLEKEPTKSFKNSNYYWEAKYLEKQII